MIVDAWSAAEAVRSGEITSEQLVRDALARIDRVDPEVNAFTVVLREQAVAEARAADQHRGGGARDEPRPGAGGGPMHGIPISVKDHIWLAGTPATNGSVALRDFVPTMDAVAVARLRAAGAIVVGKTNNPEFCYRGYTDNDLWG
ncbi:MAG: amidase family protein, partial [Chloroflexota bacterium]|nr:amidase family protein [Chloroflexota bacterium]